MKVGLLRFLGLFFTVFLLVAPAWTAEPYLVLDGADVVEVGQTATYNVETKGGTDSGYTWWLGYVSNNAATIDENGVLTASNPGIAGVRVSGNDTGVVAEHHVEIVPNHSERVIIQGPDKVGVGKTDVFSATTGGESSEYNWFIIHSSGMQIATINADTGEFEGVSEGTVTLCAVDKATGLSGEKTVHVVESEKQSAHVAISAGLGEGFTLDLMLSIQGQVPEEAKLYIAVKYDDKLHYLPTLSTTPEPFEENPKETFFEKVLSVGIADIPYKTYTFYAALLNSSFEFVSNLDTAEVKAGRR